MQGTLKIDRISFWAGSAIAVLLGVLIAGMSSGLSLMVLALPGLAISWIVFGMFYLRQTDLVQTSRILPLYFATMAVQVLHFAEEYAAGYASSFPELYGGTPYPLDLFVFANMAACAVFMMTCLASFLWGATMLLVPVFFFAINVTFGNAVAHTWWAMISNGYFPGLITGLTYWVLGPLLIFSLLGSLRQALTLMVVLAGTLVFCLTRYMVVPA